ncbi:MAG: ABC transporter permease, partial [Flavisolibacter sp.]
VSWTGKIEMTYGEKRVFFPEMFFVDSTFLQIFDFPLLKGDRNTVLEKPNSIVLTEDAAKKLFGNDNPIGKTITHYGDDTTSFMVKGIMKNIPDNSQFQFDGLMSFNSIYNPSWLSNWGGNWLNTYLVLNNASNAIALEKKFPAYLKKYMAKDDNYKNYELFLQPLKNVHAGSNDISLDYINYQKFDKAYLKLFIVIALIVLAIACINFMNLSTASSSERAREVGVRKSIGAYRSQLSLQFIGESVFLSFIAAVIAILLVEAFLPFVNHLSQRSLHLSLFSDLKIPVILISGTIVIGVLSGLYPAAYLSSFEPVKVLKGSIHTGKNKGRFRNILVIGQFTCAIFLIIATILRSANYASCRNGTPVLSEIM